MWFHRHADGGEGIERTDRHRVIADDARHTEQLSQACHRDLAPRAPGFTRGKRGHAVRTLASERPIALEVRRGSVIPRPRTFSFPSSPPLAFSSSLSFFPLFSPLSFLDYFLSPIFISRLFCLLFFCLVYSLISLSFLLSPLSPFPLLSTLLPLPFPAPLRPSASLLFLRFRPQYNQEERPGHRLPSRLSG